MINKKYSLFLFLAVFLLLPFERIPTFELIGFTVKLSYVAFILFFIFFARKTPSLFKDNKLTRSDICLILFWLSGVVSLLFTPNLKRSVIVLGLWAFVFGLYLVFSRILKDKELRAKVEGIIIFVSVLVSLFGIYQFIGDSLGLSMGFTGLRIQYTKIVMGFPRIQSVALEPLYFSNYLLVPTFLVIKNYLLREGRKNYWSLSILFLFLVNIILGISRGAYLALIFSFLILFAFIVYSYFKKDGNYLKKLMGIIAVLLIAIVFSVLMVRVFNGHKATDNFSGHATVDDTQTGSSVPGRLDGYKIAFKLFEKKPIFGDGVASFGPLTVGSEKDLEQYGYGIVNNEYLEILTETGIVGFALFAIFIILIFIEFYQKSLKLKGEKRLSLLLIALGILAILIQYNFFSTLYIIYIWAFLALFKGEIESVE
ncbi:MAG: O-antigen ligase family protein [bacterium]